ncbi:unnamed protein product [Bursaphelenchus okinawaensis]|uniref:G protein-coupled receptor n=1 Tax=Bursaphelenchus okinawaensis TaxID=465554 RepID=A0A811LL24_9BILA|nr:unnamed protein product [Bursaphelenchus okinawaensis]CAG9125052.1 unnamed protein product [Bursaphelenchus okinawaensis]
MNTMSKQYDDMLTVNPIFKDRLPNAYLVGDTTTSIPYFFHALHCQVVLIVCYIVTIIFGFKTWKAMAENHLDLTPEREEMQREISRIMILQAIYPVIAMGIPLFALAAVPFLNGGAADFYWLGMVGIGLINIIPILNSLSVIFVIPQYRKAVIGQ